MRRFEFIEGSSSKFWEITLLGSSFTVRWGRLGTQGQTQQKDFASEAKALQEHDKLISEKTKKGYAEVGSGEGPAQQVAPMQRTPSARAAEVSESAPMVAAPAAEPVMAGPVVAAPAVEPGVTAPAVAPPPPRNQLANTVAPPPAQGAVFWDDAYRSRVYPRRGGVAVPVRPLSSARKAWGLARPHLEKIAPRLSGVGGAEAKPSILGKLKKALSSVEAPVPVLHLEELTSRIANSEPQPGSLGADTLLVALLEHRGNYDDRSRAQPAVDLLVGLSGLARATEAVIGSFSLRFSDREGGLGPLVLSDASDPPWYARFNSNRHAAPPRLRELLATSGADDYEAARTAASALTELTDEQELVRAFLFPDQEAWVSEVVNHQLQGKHHDLIVASIGTPELAERVAPAVSGWELFRREKDVLPSLLDALGVKALSFLRAMAPSAVKSGSDPLREWADAVSRLHDEAALALLFENLVKETLPYAVEAGQRWPVPALRALGLFLAQRGKGGDDHRTLGVQILRHAPGLVDAAWDQLPSETQAFITAARAASGPELPEAAREQVPPVLRDPPWVQGRSRPVTSGTAPPAPAVPASMRWRPGEQAAWAQQQGSAWRQDYSGYTPAQWTELSRSRQPPRLNGSFFIHAPEALALQWLPEWPMQDYGDSRWLPAIAARFELRALEFVIQAVARSAENLAVALPFAAPTLAPQVAALFATSKRARPDARAWLARNPGEAAAGLLVPALAAAGREASQAGDALRWLAQQGHRPQILEVAASVGAAEAVAGLLDQDPLQLFPARLPKLPSFFNAGALPRPVLADRSRQLPLPAVEALGTMLSFTLPDAPYAGIAQVKEACDPASLARFAWGLFEAWMAAGSPSKEGWAFQALGLLGDDDSVRKLAPMIREWPGEAAHARAVAGLEVLAAIGTDVALTYLNGIAEKVKFKGLQQRARDKIEEVAETRGLTRDELSDRLVPDLGLDAQGSLLLDYGGRTFTVGFDEQLKPFVKDPAGARLKELPSPGKKDDPDQAGAAQERWKALKKDAKTVSSLQILRMELGMCARRRWPAAVFQQFFVQHPLLVHVVRRLVWGTYDVQGRLLETFRVAEDRSFAGPEDEAWSLPADAQVGLPHALELEPSLAGRWGQVLGDYQLLQPFPQLGRPSFSMSPEDAASTGLLRVKGLTVNTGKVLGLEARGWRRGPALDGGVVGWMEKPAGPDRIIALDLEPGLYIGMLSESPEQTLGAARLTAAGSWGTEGEYKLDTLDRIAFSELVRDLEGLRS